MMRWRPPTPGSSPYITPAGAAALHAELDQLWRRERPQVTAQVQAAAKNGDRSENGDYIYGKRRLREIDRRIRYLRHRLEALIVVAEPPADCGRVRFGAWVSLRDAVDAAVIYRLVGADEIDPQRGWISIDSPLARALLGRANGDQVTVEGPGGTADYRVVGLTYGEENPTA
ncbi:MAG: transcription elongation factor GreB [Gammaproteobacteria bacterium]|nr:transcription elongation factor GreB [Gammaproteobacteria bacterium]MBK8132503.1 transcription elongation factor GreB [Gammaproteobacteria bacterium]MBK9428507.1 transcription elongation factor GreB [Gammaproteobacteria bacterium]